MVSVACSRKNRKMVNPETVRLSPHILLSDLMGCHSAYVKGYANVFQDKDGTKLTEGVCLAETVLEVLLEKSPISISYGYISLDLARKIVTYQSPEKPSYHQWNDGAAADVLVHNFDEQDIAPIYIAQACDAELPMSRTITYSESPYMCLGVRHREIMAGKPRKAFYENQYLGRPRAKPKYITIPDDRAAYFEKHELLVDWRGCGHPSYHGGGHKQTQHIRVGKYSMFSDFLYSTEALTLGYKNCPIPTDPWVAKFSFVGGVYEKMLDDLAINRLSIVRAFENPGWSDDDRYHWKEEFAFDVIPPAFVDPLDVVDAAHEIEGVNSVACNMSERRVTVRGLFPK